MKNSVKLALEDFKATVKAKNLAVLEVIIHALTSRPTPPHMTPEYANAKRFDWLKKTLGSGITSFASSPEDLLSDAARAELVSRLELDGVSHEPVNQEARDRWVAAIQEGISISGLDVEVAYPPAELEELCRAVSSVYGAGLPDWREMKGFDLLAPARRQEQASKTRRRVILPSRGDDEDGDGEPTSLDLLWEDWEIGVAVKIGDGCSISNGGSYALWCRAGDADEWKWRYAVHDGEWCSNVYGSLEEYLEFFARFGEQSEEKAEYLAMFEGM